MATINRKTEDRYLHTIDGNTVRRAVPERVAPPERRQNRRSRYEERRNAEKARQMNAPFVLFLAVASAAVMFAAAGYLQARASLVSRMERIEQQEAQLLELKDQNVRLSSQIDTQMDLNEIYRIATEELGMVYPSEDQIIRYPRQESEYVRQYENIPD